MGDEEYPTFADYSPDDFASSSPPRKICKEGRQLAPLCGCGCGQPTKIITHTTRKRGIIKGEYNKFINGHQCRGSNNPMYGLVGKKCPNYGKNHSDEVKDKISKANSGKKHHFYGKHHTKESKQKISNANKDRKVSEETKRKMSEAHKGSKAYWYGKRFSETTRRKMAESNKINWEDPEFVSKMQKAFNIKPTSYEKKIIELNSLHNLGFKYVGDFKEFINGKNPDFINESKKLIIECYSLHYKLLVYESEESYRRERIKVFPNYKVIFLNDHDLTAKNWQEICLDKIKDFI